ncbi:GAF and ANTAR domain-containing protein [Actinocrispum sp. NPDC049592]|uniref:GAF and ANTAR domain-containing protein n=1 Tax=Actinocrispum sp. NPDC049592 TaxID=3154835 RepID=UPI00343C4AC0
MADPWDERLAKARAALLHALHGTDPLGAVCRSCVRLVPVAGASVSMTGGRAQAEMLCSTDDLSARIEALQFTLGEGPTVDAFTAGRPVLVPDVPGAPAQAWPMFAQAMTGQAVGAIFAFPLQYGAISIGMLSLYRERPGWLSGGDLAIALEIVDVAALALLNHRTGVLNGEQLAFLPRGREQIHQATGMLIAALGIPADQALARLRGHAFATGRLIDEVAHDIVNRHLHPRDLDQ